jgi:hypothetical protein
VDNYAYDKSFYDHFNSNIGMFVGAELSFNFYTLSNSGYLEKEHNWYKYFTYKLASRFKQTEIIKYLGNQDVVYEIDLKNTF